MEPRPGDRAFIDGEWYTWGPVKWHKKRRISKKWAKRYGYKWHKDIKAVPNPFLTDYNAWWMDPMSGLY